MALIEIITAINAPIERVFDLARSIDLHLASTAQTREQAIGGVTAGLIGLDQEVTWRARHFGVWQEMTSRITSFARPRYFRDTMKCGPFQSFEHDHYFAVVGGQTRMRDVLNFTAPFGVLGRFAESVFLTAYLRRFLRERNLEVKQAAESEEWRRYLSEK